MNEYEELVERCAKEIWREFQTNKSSSSQNLAKVAIAEVLRTLETVTPEMIEAGDDLVPIARGTESYRGFPVPEKVFAVMLRASPLVGSP
jgi:hypothetical protein